MFAIEAPRLETVPRRPGVPAWALVVGAVWIVEVGLYAWLSGRAGGLPPLCPLRATTGVPCPLCGSTRAAMAAGQGRLLDAFLFNPLVCAAAAGLLAVLVLRVGFGRRVALSRAAGSRWVAWSAFVGLVLVNWMYVVWQEKS